jgi:hypothetical protein
MAVTGEQGYSSQGKTAVKRVFEPFNQGDYPLALVGQSVEISKGQDSGVPYVKASFVARGTALAEGQKDRRVFHSFFLSIDPSPKGNVAIESADQMLGLARSLGQELEFTGDDIINVTGTTKAGEEYETRLIDPRVAKEWLMQQDGLEVMGHVKVRRGQMDKKTNKKYDDKNEIAYFIESDTAVATPVEEEEPLPTSIRKAANGKANGAKNGKAKR